MNVGSDVLILSGQNFEEDLEFAELGVAVPEEVVTLKRLFLSNGGDPTFLPVVERCTAQFAYFRDVPDKWIPPTNFFLFEYKVVLETGPFRVNGEGEMFCKLHGEKGDSEVVSLGTLKPFSKLQARVLTEARLGSMYAVTVGHSNPRAIINVTAVSVMDEAEGILVEFGPDYRGFGDVLVGHEENQDINSDERPLNDTAPFTVMEAVTAERLRGPSDHREPRLVIGKWRFADVTELSQAMSSFSHWLKRNPGARCLHISFNASFSQADVYTSVEPYSIAETVQRKQSAVLIGVFGRRVIQNRRHRVRKLAALYLTSRIRMRPFHLMYRFVRAVGLVLWRRSRMSHFRREHGAQIGAALAITSASRRILAVLELRREQDAMKRLDIVCRIHFDRGQFGLERVSATSLQAHFRCQIAYGLRQKWLRALAARRELMQKRIGAAGVMLTTYSEASENQGLGTASRPVSVRPPSGPDTNPDGELYEEEPEDDDEPNDEAQKLFDQIMQFQSILPPIHPKKKKGVFQRLIGGSVRPTKLEDIVGVSKPVFDPRPKKYKWTGFSLLKESDNVELPPLPRLPLSKVNLGGGVYKYSVLPAATSEPSPPPQRSPRRNQSAVPPSPNLNPFKRNRVSKSVE